MNTKTIIFVGDGGVGKTSFINRINGGDFVPQYTPTKGICEYHFERSSSQSWKLLDIAGQEKFNLSIPENIDYCVAMFSLAHLISFKNVKCWIMAIRNVNSDIPVLLVGNECELEHKITQKQIDNLCKDIKCEYLEISAKTQQDLQTKFLEAVN